MTADPQGGAMKKALIPAFMLALASTVLGATVLREPLAWAAAPIASVLVTNDESNPVPVREQNLDPDGHIKVHEQGTADVHVTNGSLRVTPEPQPAAGGGGSYTASACPGEVNFERTIIASALQIAWFETTGAFVKLRRGTSQVADIFGPLVTGERQVVLSLTRPIAFDNFLCHGSSDVVISWVGDE
jgi:hypothetical protein